jgi:hypothetical protein
MNKRIKKKVAKREAEQGADGSADVGVAFHQLEKDVAQLARALLSEGREKTDAALAELRARAEPLLEKMPGVGPKLAEMLHAATSTDGASHDKSSQDKGSRTHP